MSTVSGGRSSSFRFMALAAAIALAGSPGAALSQPAPVARAIAGKNQRRGLFNRAVIYQASYGTKGAGINMATQKRTSKKTRNSKRHRAACRG
jgi:hypothetical protein